MSSRSDRFECRWQASRALLTAYLGAQVLALVSLSQLNIPLWAGSVGVLLCLLYGACTLRALTAKNGARAFTGLRRDTTGWHFWSEEGGWEPAQLRPDSVALPQLVILRFRLRSGSWLRQLRVRSLCIPADAMAPDSHRRLRLRLKFSRRRWAAPE